jgi:hypothetical protein
MLHPYELRRMLEREAKAAFDQARAENAHVDPSALAGSVLMRHQEKPEVQHRLAFLWLHLESYLQSLIE